MRPQRNAAENKESAREDTQEKIASMRPQRNAAENGAPPKRPGLGPRASMRPQRNAAENTRTRPRRQARLVCFNEAAA